MTLTILGIVIFSSWINSVHEVTSDLSKKNSDEIALQVSRFLDEPLKLNMAHSDLIANDYVDMLNQEEREKFFVMSLQVYNVQVLSFAYGTVNGEYYGARRNGDTIEIMRNDATTGGSSWYYSVNEDLTANEKVLETSPFDPRTRPWYIETVNSGHTIFSSVYEHFVFEDLAISIATPIYDDQGTLKGVLATHMILSNINTFISANLSNDNGSGIIIDMNSNYLIANSMGLANFIILENNTVSRISIDELENTDYNRAYQQYLLSQNSNFEFRDNFKYVYYSLEEIHENGIDWLIITSIPQGVLFESVIQNILWVIIGFILSSLVLIIVVHYLIIKVFEPVNDLVEASNEYSKGNFKKRISTSGKDEFSKLANAYNMMADQIRDIVNGLEETVLVRTEHLKIANSTLKESEERFKVLHNASFGGIAIHDQGLIIDCNQGLSDITGYSMDDITGMNITLLIVPEDKDLVIEKIETGDEKPYEVFGLKKNNEKYPLRLEARNMPYKGKIVRVVEFKDMTDIKKSESEIQYKDKLLGCVISNSNQGIAVHDKDLNYVYVSDAYCDIYHVSKDIVGKHHYDVFPDLPQKWRDVHQRTLKGEVLSSDRDLFIRADGRELYTKWLSRPWYNANGDINGIIIYTEVINNLVETEIELQKALSRLQLVMDNLTIGIAVNSVDPEVKFEYMNSNFPVFYGSTREALMKEGAFWNVVYEDVEFRDEIKKKVLEGLASDDPKLMRWENIPIIHNGKIVRYVTSQNVKIPSSPLFISMVMDVTNQKHKEEEILYASKHDFMTGLPNRRYFEEKLMDLDKPENFPLIVAMFDLDGLKLINDAYGHDTGDQALIKISQIIRETVRTNDFVARVGGDEFIVVCPKTTKEQFEITKELISLESSAFEDLDFKISISIGYDIKNDIFSNIKDILKNAEDGMYANKILHGQSTRNETIMTLFEALREKYEEEKLHSNRVSEYCKMMGENLGLSNDQIKELEFAGLMHDIGKITIPDRILDKPRKLTDIEWDIMKTHTINGYQILRSADKYSQLAEYALTHHERWDGKGYPNGLKGEEIPLFSRVISVCDAFEAMTADRPYRKALDYRVAIDELNRCAGSQFDSKLVEIFIKAIVVKENLTIE